MNSLTSDIRYVIVDIECLFDVRIGILARHYPELAHKALKDPRYYTREMDTYFTEVLGIPETIWYGLINRRDVNDLRASVVTTLPYALLDFIKQEIEGVNKPTDGSEFSLIINTQQYALLSEEIRVLKEELLELMPVWRDIEFRHIPLENLSPRQLDRSIESIWLYDISKWTEKFGQAFSEQPRPQLKVFAPKLIHRQAEQLDEEQTELVKALDKFEIMEGFFSLFFLLTFIETKYICLPESISKQFKS